MVVRTIGVLALQGDFARHQMILTSLGCGVCPVRYSEELQDIDALVIPGGESTTISRHLDRTDLRAALFEFAQKRPVMGTCAGLILMAREPSDARVCSLDLLDIAVERNSWGRQVQSFTSALDICLNGSKQPFHAVFIRAPRIRDIGSGIEVLARLGDEPVLVRQGSHLGASFHPELTDDVRIHQLFLENVVK